MAQYHVKNTSHLDKAFKVRGGHQVVAAGKEEIIKDARELSEAQIDAFAREGVKVSVKAEEKTKDEGKGALPKTAAEVLAMATAEGVHFKTFEAEAKKLLGDKTPSGKDEIVKALEELAAPKS
jgi:hypothetical protein